MHIKYTIAKKDNDINNNNNKSNANKLDQVEALFQGSVLR